MDTLDQEPLLEEPVEGSDKLYLIFGGRKAGMGVPQFEFCKAANILNHNKVYIRDLRQSWYQRGLPGISTDLLSTVEPLQEIISKYPHKELITVGNSMGGFAAIFFAATLGNAHAIAFAPQTFVSPALRIANRDKRWNREILRLYASTLFKPKQFNLLQTIEKHGKTDWEADIVVASDHRLDHLHAKHLDPLPQTRIRKYEGASHRIVKDLRDRGELAKILQGDFSGALPAS